MQRSSQVRIACLIIATLITNPVVMAAPAFAQLESSQDSGLQSGRGYDPRIIEEVVVNGQLMNDGRRPGTAIELPRDNDSGWPN